jgi:LCCL domain
MQVLLMFTKNRLSLRILPISVLTIGLTLFPPGLSAYFQTAAQAQSADGAATLPTDYVGIWSGRGSQDGSELSILIGLTPGPTETVVGTFAYPSLSCGGTLTLLSVDGQSIKLAENLTYGQGCPAQSTVSLELTTSRQMQYQGLGADAAIVTTGTVERISAESPVDDGNGGGGDAPTDPVDDPTVIDPQPAESISWTTTAANRATLLDQDFTYSCPTNGRVGSVTGTDTYRTDSSICSAAVHTGLINTIQGGIVRIRILPSTDYFVDTTRNGVSSSASGLFRPSFTFINRTTGAPVRDLSVQTIGWAETADARVGRLDQQFSYLCLPNGQVRTVTGTDRYRTNSSICTAAVHAGRINITEGGVVKIVILPGALPYVSTTRNGITTNSSGVNSGGSFSFVD